MTSLDRKLDIVADQCLALRARLVSRKLTSIYDTALRPHGLKANQMTLLVLVYRRGVVRPADVCQILNMDASTLSRNVERMRARGWLEIVEDEDARAVPFQLSAEGQSLLEAAYPAWQGAQKQASALLGDAGVRDLSRLAERIWSGSK